MGGGEGARRKGQEEGEKKKIIDDDCGYEEAEKETATRSKRRKLYTQKIKT